LQCLRSDEICRLAEVLKTRVYNKARGGVEVPPPLSQARSKRLQEAVRISVSTLT